MSTTRKITQVQYPMSFILDVTPADVGNFVAVDVPPGFILTKAALVKRTAFNGTTPTITVTDNKASPTTIIASSDATAVADVEASTALGTDYPSGGTIKVALANAGGTTNAGAADVLIQGVVRGRQNERYGS